MFDSLVLRSSCSSKTYYHRKTTSSGILPFLLVSFGSFLLWCDDDEGSFTTKRKSLQLGTYKEEITSDDSCVRLLHSLLVVAYEKPIIKKKLIVLSMVGFICMIHIIRLANRKARFINSCYRKKVLLSSKC